MLFFLGLPPFISFPQIQFNDGSMANNFSFSHPQLSTRLSDLADSPTSVTLDGLRQLERKTATVCTLLKASVYSIVLQQQIFNEGEEQQQQGGDGEHETGTMNVGDEGGYGHADMSYQEGY